YQVPSPITRPIAARSPSAVRTAAQAQLFVSAPAACAAVRGLSPATWRRRTYSRLVGAARVRRNPAGSGAAGGEDGVAGEVDGEDGRSGMPRSCQAGGGAGILARCILRALI